MRPLPAAVLAQIAGAAATIAFVRLAVPELGQFPLAMAALQGGCAAVASRALKAPGWWVPIHLVFLPLAVLMSRLPVAPGWYLAAFFALLLVFWRTDRSRVPLYLSNEATAAAVAALLPATPCYVIDLGCGTGGLLARLARARPDCTFLGIEHAPLPWLWARLSTWSLPNCGVHYGDFWRQPMGLFDVAYAFLSPAPMAELWAKAQAEMRPESLVVSNSFPVPGVAADRTVDVADRRHTRLYCYRPGR